MGSGQNHTSASPGEYTIVWKFMPDGWARGLSQSKAPGVMPYFVDGEPYRKLQQKEGVELTSYALLCGILLCWFEDENFWIGQTRETMDGFLEALLEDLRRGFGIPSMEEMILNAAASVRDRHGPLHASRMLTAGNNILPTSARIRSDLIHDVWAILEETDEIDRESAFRFIVKVYRGIEFEDVESQMVGRLDYFYLVSLAFLGRRRERDLFFWRTASKRVNHPLLKERMFRLLKDVDLDFHSYRIRKRKELYH